MANLLSFFTLLLKGKRFGIYNGRESCKMTVILVPTRSKLLQSTGNQTTSIVVTSLGRDDLSCDYSQTSAFEELATRAHKIPNTHHLRRHGEQSH